MKRNLNSLLRGVDASEAEVDIVRSLMREAGVDMTAIARPVLKEMAFFALANAREVIATLNEGYVSLAPYAARTFKEEQ